MTKVLPGERMKFHLQHSPHEASIGAHRQRPSDCRWPGVGTPISDSFSWIRKPQARSQIPAASEPERQHDIGPGESASFLAATAAWVQVISVTQQRLMFLAHGVDLYTRSLQALLYTLHYKLSRVYCHSFVSQTLQPAGSERVNRRANWRGTGISTEHCDGNSRQNW